MINEFKDKYDFLSNFYTANITYNGITYRNNEAAFQSQKVDDNWVLQKEFSALNPSEAKRAGRKVRLREDWEAVKDQIMYEICLAKFTQHNDLKRKLLATGDQELIEGNWWHDNCWGDCSCDKCKNIKGQNKLGKILMRVREELK